MYMSAFKNSGYVKWQQESSIFSSQGVVYKPRDYIFITRKVKLSLMGKYIVFQSHADLEAQILVQGPEGVRCSSQHIVI